MLAQAVFSRCNLKHVQQSSFSCPEVIDLGHFLLSQWRNCAKLGHLRLVQHSAEWTPTGHQMQRSIALFGPILISVNGPLQIHIPPTGCCVRSPLTGHSLQLLQPLDCSLNWFSQGSVMPNTPVKARLAAHDNADLCAAIMTADGMRTERNDPAYS